MRDLKNSVNQAEERTPLYRIRLYLFSNVFGDEKNRYGFQVEINNTDYIFATTNSRRGTKCEVNGRVVRVAKIKKIKRCERLSDKPVAVLTLNKTLLELIPRDYLLTF